MQVVFGGLGHEQTLYIKMSYTPTERIAAGLLGIESVDICEIKGCIVTLRNSDTDQPRVAAQCLLVLTRCYNVSLDDSRIIIEASKSAYGVTEQERQRLAEYITWIARQSVMPLQVAVSDIASMRLDASTHYILTDSIV